MEKIKVCHLTIPHSRYDERIFLKECCSLANAGYDVTLLCADNRTPEIKNGVKIESIDFTPKNKMQRILGAKSKMLPEALKIDAEIYHFHDPELLPVGLALKKKGKKVIYDSHEDVPKQILTKSWIPKIFLKFISYIYEYYEMKICRNLDCIITVTPHIVERFRKFHNNVWMITNYPRSEENFMTSKLKKEQKICFAGGISKQWMHENIISAIPRNINVKYCLAGPIEDQYLANLQKLDNWNKVDYLGYLDRGKILTLYQTSLAGLALNDYIGNVGYKIGSLGNTKLFEYMQAALPVICTNFQLWQEIIDEYYCGIYVDPHDLTAITNAIEFIINNEEQAKQMGLNGVRAVQEKYNWENQEKRLFELYHNLLLKIEIIL